MKAFQKIAPLSVLAFLALASCDSAPQSHQEAEADHDDSESGVTYKANRGLRVPDGTAKAIQLTIADVEERRVKSEFHFSAQVFQAAGGVQRTKAVKPTPGLALASADLNHDEAKVLKSGQRVNAQTDTGEVLPAHVTEVHFHNERSDAHVDVTIGIEDRGDQLRPGSFIKVSVPVGGTAEVISVPRSALLQTSEGKFVYTVNGQDFVRTAVKVGVQNEEQAEITDGLYAGDKVVVNPVMTLWMAELQSIRGGKACADGH